MAVIDIIDLIILAYPLAKNPADSKIKKEES
jgi:hypothetical protein